MLKNLISVFCVFCLLTACSEKKPPITGIDGSAIPPAFANFPDMPFPASAYVDLEDTKALGSGNNWIGSLVFNVDYSPSEVFDFYMSEMPKLGWIEVATVRARVSHMTYIQGRRAVQILIEMDSSDSSFLLLAAGNFGKMCFFIRNGESKDTIKPKNFVCWILGISNVMKAALKSVGRPLLNIFQFIRCRGKEGI